jgi:hypothetical protein
MFFEGRGATEITILNPFLPDASLRDIVTNFATLRALTSTVVIACKDQLGEGATIKYMEMMEATIKACSNAPALKTKVGAEATATVNISSTKKPLFMLATNAKEFSAVSPATNKAYTMGDDSGLRTGSSGRPFKTVIFRAYENGVPDTNADNWIIFPAADVEGNVEQAYNNNADRGYQITFTAYDPNETNRKIIIGNPNLIIPPP